MSIPEKPVYYYRDLENSDWAEIREFVNAEAINRQMVFFSYSPDNLETTLHSSHGLEFRRSESHPRLYKLTPHTLYGDEGLLHSPLVHNFGVKVEEVQKGLVKITVNVKDQTILTGHITSHPFCKEATQEIASARDLDIDAQGIMVPMMALVPEGLAEFVARNGLIYVQKGGTEPKISLHCQAICLPGRLISRYSGEIDYSYGPETLYYINKLDPRTKELIARIDETGDFDPLALISY